VLIKVLMLCVQREFEVIRLLDVAEKVSIVNSSGVAGLVILKQYLSHGIELILFYVIPAVSVGESWLAY